MSTAPAIVWFRQDLRLTDNPAVAAAAAHGSVVPVYIWAPAEEGRWPPGGASRWWLHHSLAALGRQLAGMGSRLVIRRGPARQALAELIAETGSTAVYWNRRYEPAARKRDRAVEAALRDEGVEVADFNGALLFEPWTIATGQGKPYQVFTPFWKACRAAGVDHDPHDAAPQLPAPKKWPRSLGLDELALLPTIPWDREFYRTWQVGAEAAENQLAAFIADRLASYDTGRDSLADAGWSRLSPHLHFGEISPRQVWSAVEAAARANRNGKHSAEIYLKELGWREFAYHLLYHFPATAEKPLREQFRQFPWRRSKCDLRRWQRGETGYPIVDAAMRQLWATGFMPNRARMIVGSFLTKHLRLRWQHGAEWFWDTLVDADLANNTLGWQWTAGCGADAAPYFRIFNPVAQAERYDPEGAYIRRWVPELERLPAPWIFKPWEAPPEVLAEGGVKLGKAYPKPMVYHAKAREAALAAYQKVRHS